MSISQGIALGLDISRGARQEARTQAEHNVWLQEQQADAAHREKLRPLELEQANLGLAEAKDVAAYNQQVRPMQLDDMRDNRAHQQVMRPIEQQQAQIGLDDLRADANQRKQLRPLELRQAQQGIEAGNIDIQNARTRQKWAEQDRVKGERAERYKRVQELAPAEYDRFMRTGKFSEHFLRASADTPLSPLLALDPEYSDALNQAVAYFDPRNQQANPYADGKVFDVANIILGKELNNGGVNPQTGLPIVSKRIVGAYPATGPDGKPLKGQMLLELEMTDEKGNTYRAPVTQNRSGDDDDPIQPVDFGQLVGRVNAQKMFADAIRSNPEGMKWLQAKAKGAAGTGGQQPKSDETMWAGRPQKTEDVFKRYKENSLYGNAETGEQYVSMGDFEWTAGEPTKLRFLESVARENRIVMQEYQRMAKDDPEEARTYLQTNFVDDVEALWDIQTQKKADKAKGKNDKADQLVNQLTSDESKTSPQSDKPKDPDWYLKETISVSENKSLSAEEQRRRYEWLANQRRQNEAKQAEQQKQQQAEQDAAKAAAQQMFQSGAYKNLTGAERQQWLNNNLRHLSLEQRKNLIGNN